MKIVCRQGLPVTVPCTAQTALWLSAWMWLHTTQWAPPFTAIVRLYCRAVLTAAMTSVFPVHVTKWLKSAASVACCTAAEQQLVQPSFGRSNARSRYPTQRRALYLLQQVQLLEVLQLRPEEMGLRNSLGSASKYWRRCAWYKLHHTPADWVLPPSPAFWSVWRIAYTVLPQEGGGVAISWASYSCVQARVGDADTGLIPLVSYPTSRFDMVLLWTLFEWKRKAKQSARRNEAWLLRHSSVIRNPFGLARLKSQRRTLHQNTQVRRDVLATVRQLCPPESCTGSGVKCVCTNHCVVCPGRWAKKVLADMRSYTWATRCSRADKLQLTWRVGEKMI